jgi:cell wall-associated NlpC family hydrolase
MKNYGICLLSVIPCRKEPSSTSEMVTQLLFGETYLVLEEQEKWLQIESSYDAYKSWISRTQFVSLTEKEFHSLSLNNLNGEFIQVISDSDNDTMFPLSIGATLPNLVNQKIEIANRKFLFEGAVVSFAEKKLADSIKQIAYLFLNAPYLWGGRSPFGIDCSGFTQLVFKLNGYKIPRDASQQVELGNPLNFVEEAEVGDLAFFDNEQGNIVHVGLVLENQFIIHASGSVRIDKFDHYGIFHSETKKYTHSLRVIKRIL